MVNILKSYVARLTGSGLGPAGIPSAFAYQQRYDRSFAPYAGVSRAAQEAAGITTDPKKILDSTALSGDGGAYEGPQPTDGDRIVDLNNDGIPDGVNIFSGSGDTYRVGTVAPVDMATLSQKYAEERALEAEKEVSAFSAQGIKSNLSRAVTKAAKGTFGINTRFDILTGREVLTGAPSTGVPLIDALAGIGSSIAKKNQPALQDAAAKAAQGVPGYGIFTLGGGQAVALTPDGILGDVAGFVKSTGRTQTQLINEMQDLTDSGKGGGYLGDAYESYVDNSTNVVNMSNNMIRGRSVYEDMILDSQMSTATKSSMLGGAYLSPTTGYYEGRNFPGFVGAVSQMADTGQIVTSKGPGSEGFRVYQDYGGYEDIEPETTTTYTGGYDEAPVTYSPPSFGDDGGDSGPSVSTPSDGPQESAFDNVDDNEGLDPDDYAQGGRVSMANGGITDLPAQGTGFVEGSPDNYSKEETVADTVHTSVKNGSFILNAPTVERLQGKGYLPTEVDNSGKSNTIEGNEGGLIDVALSKGEVIIEPEEAEKLGYNFLNSLNDLGKPEVDKRQANMGGTIGLALGGISSGNTGVISSGNTGFLGMFRAKPQLTTPNVTVPPTSENTEPKVPLSESFLDQGMLAIPEVPIAKQGFDAQSRDLLLLLEGNPEDGYVPKKTTGVESGVTIGMGFDVGQHSLSDLENMDLPDSLISKLVPYVNKKDDDARAVLKAEPLRIEGEELALLNEIVYDKKLGEFDRMFPQYRDIPDPDRAVMFSAAYLGALQKTKDYPKGRYLTFMNTYKDANNMKDSIKKGILARIEDKGDAEYNRAKKALEWYSNIETQTMSLPTSRPN